MKKVKITSLCGKTALITGASSGICKATAIALARKGVNLILVSRGIEKLKETQAELKPFNVKTVILPGDVSNNDEMSEIIQKALLQFEKIDFLICSAGMYYRRPAPVPGKCSVELNFYKFYKRFIKFIFLLIE